MRGTNTWHQIQVYVKRSFTPNKQERQWVWKFSHHLYFFQNKTEIKYFKYSMGYPYWYWGWVTNKFCAWTNSQIQSMWIITSNYIHSVYIYIYTLCISFLLFFKFKYSWSMIYVSSVQCSDLYTTLMRSPH